MKGIIFLLLSFLIGSTGLYAQVNWFERPIATAYDGAWGVYAVDMDGDVDIDIVGVAHNVNDISWWENDGYQNFTKHTIDNNINGGHETHVDDLNGDGDIDVIGVGYHANAIYIYDNDGSMNFTRIDLVTNYHGASYAHSYDIDDDDDKDIVTCTKDGGDVTWWENIGYPNFARHDVDLDFNGCRHVDASDLDNDGDADILASAEYIDQIAWYENDGNQVFQKHVIQGNYGAFWAKPFDFNNDGAWDILGCAAGNDDISWWENDGNMNFSRHVIDDNVGMPQSVEAADFDSDGDLDIVAAMRYIDGISWWENDNNTNFTKYHVDQSLYYAVTVFPIDLDQDSDTDVIGGAFGEDKLSWWENLTIFDPGFVVGTVIDNYGSPVESVYVDPSRTTIFDFTDFYGYYELALPAATYEITFQKNGYYEYTFPYVQVTAGDTAIVNVGIVKIPTGFVLGNVVDEYAVPLEDVYVYAENTNYGDSTDENGDYSFEVIVGIHDITFVKTGYYDTTLYDIGIGLNDTLYHDMIMVQVMPGIWGKILNKEPAPVESVLVSVINTPVSVYSDHYGEFSIENLAQGVYDILFQHPYYFDTTITDISVEPGYWDSLYVSLESKSAITGFVGDIDSIPLADVQVSAVGTDLCTYSDSTGHYFLRIIPGTNYSIKYSKVNFLDQIVPNIMVSIAETLVLDSVYLQPRLTTEVVVWYGNPDLSPITAPIGDTVMVDLYVYTAPYLDIGFVHLPLGTDDQYIIDHLSASEGVLYYPLTDWDDVQFLPPDGPPQMPPGWHSQSLLGFYDIYGPPNPPLHCPETTRIASYAFEVVYDTSLIGDTVDCFTEGYNIANGEPLLGDVNGVDPYFPYQHFSPLLFVEPAPPEISVWYGNPDSMLISAPIGDTIFIDVYVQSTDSISLDSLHLPLATDDQYIVAHHSESTGVLYYPLTEWDYADFLPPDELSPGWHSQSLLGVADTGGNPNPYLQCLQPTRIASFTLEIVNDSSIIGDTADCFMEGFHPVNGGPLFRDSNGVNIYYPDQFFPSLYFIEPISGGCEYIVGDANNDSTYNGMDITYGVIYFKGGPAPPYECECTPGDIWHVSGDVNSSCSYNGVDITYGVAYFKGGPDPIPCPDCPPETEINIAGKEKVQRR